MSASVHALPPQAEISTALAAGSRSSGDDASVAPRSIRARKVKLPLGAEIPKHWFGGSAVATHVVNGVNLLFPAGERFFVRSVKHYLARFEHEPAVAAEIRAFFGQEGNHAREHERFFAVMEDQGYEIRAFLRRYEWFSHRVFERVTPPALRLATTAACEHYTAILAEYALDGGILDRAHPVMRDLLKWHAAEEIEHKAVAFDVLQRVSSSYLLRVAGMVVASLMLGTWWFQATRMLLRQDGMTRREIRRQVRELRAAAPPEGLGAGAGGIARSVFWKGIRSYLRRDFHPDERDNYHLAESFLAEFERRRAGTG